MAILFSTVPLAVFLIWILYRLLVKRDIKQHLNTLYPGLFFCGIWGMIYWWMLS